MKSMLTGLALAGALLGGAAAHATDPAVLKERGETEAQRDARMQWFRDARFGMFIHWGLYAQAGGEWNGKPARAINGCQEWLMCAMQIPVAEYAKLAKDFDPVKYDAEKWVLAAKAAGMKYIVITSKHHEGFAMFKTAASPFNILDATPFGRRTGRDPLRELVAACRKHGMRIGFYYSQNLDWHHPGGGSGDWDPAHKGDAGKYVDQIVIPQLREILFNYGKIDVLWFDIPGGVITKERADRIYKLAVASNPNIVINNRLGGGYQGDTETPEQHIPIGGFPGKDWEACMTMNNTWGFSKNDHNWKPAKDMVRMLCDIASKGGNYLLNVGPTEKGEIPQASLERLAAIGGWMKKNGRAIYGTKATPFRQAMPWGRVTRAGDRLYLLVFDLPADRRLALRGLSNRVLGASLLADGTKLPVSVADGYPVVTVPASVALDPMATAVEVVCEGAPEADLAIRPAADGSFTLKAADAEIVRPATGVSGVGEAEAAAHGAQLEDDHIGFWTKQEEAVAWKCAAVKAGTYTARVELACPPASAGSEVALMVNGIQAGVFSVPATGSWKDYQWTAPIAVRLPGGKVSFTAKPLTKKGEAVMNLRSVTLEPATTTETP